MDDAHAAARHMRAGKPVGKPDAGNPHVRFDERGGETSLSEILCVRHNRRQGAYYAEQSQKVRAWCGQAARDPEGAGVAVRDWSDHRLIRKTTNMPAAQQRAEIAGAGLTPIRSSNQTDFVKERVAVEVQFGKYPFVAYDLLVKLWHSMWVIWSTSG
jgi:hypothetical protein